MRATKEHYHDKIERGLRSTTPPPQSEQPVDKNVCPPAKGDDPEHSGGEGQKEHPILFSTPMVQAILEGRKTQTRRTTGLGKINKDSDIYEYHGVHPEKPLLHVFARIWRGTHVETKHVESPYGQPGDLLWVRETWAKGVAGFLYKATPKPQQFVSRWKPSIHMKKIYARLWLQIEEVRVERLQDITQEDAIAEGIELLGNHPIIKDKSLYKNYSDDAYIPGWINPINSFESLWNSINENWDANPWVWVVSFKELSRTGRPEPATSNKQPETIES